jgi:hypothetical protein
LVVNVGLNAVWRLARTRRVVRLIYDYTADPQYFADIFQAGDPVPDDLLG